MKRLRARLTYANVMATVAVFVALGGSSYAAITVTGKNVKNSSLTGKDLKNNSVTGQDVKGIKGGDVTNGSLLAQDFKTGQLPMGAQGPKGDKGEPATALFASVNDTCTSIIQGRGAVSASVHPTVSTRCDVQFDRDVSACSPVAMVAVVGGEIRGNTAGSYPPGGVAADKVALLATDSAGAGVLRPFHVAVFC